MSTLEIRYGDQLVVADVSANGTVRIDGVAFDVSPVGNGLYQVADGSRWWTVAVAGPADARWVFVDGHVAVVATASETGKHGTETPKHGEARARTDAAETRKHGEGQNDETGQKQREARKDAEVRARGPGRASGGSHELSSPMPATVVRVLVEPGQRVSRGDTLVMLEAMKMELPVRALRDAVVKAIHCKAGELVQPGVQLIELE